MEEHDINLEDQEQLKLDDYISLDERERLLSELHRFLVWVGEKIPNEIKVNGEIIKLNEVVWCCIHKKELTCQEKAGLAELARILSEKEEHDEEILKKANLNHEEAKKLYHESAALIRAIMDLRECEAGKVKLKASREEVKQKIEDAKRWLGFLKGVGKKNF